MGALYSAVGFFLVSVSQAEEIAIGVHEIPRDLNILASDELVAKLLRNGVTRALIASSPALTTSPADSNGAPIQGEKGAAAQSPYRLSIADSVSVEDGSAKDGYRNVWKFRVRGGEVFSNSLPIRAEDVVYSLRRCITAGILPKGATTSVAVRQPLPGVRESWVVVGSPPRAGVSEGSHARGEGHVSPLTWTMFAACPVLEKSSSQRFATDLGKGSNFVASGYFLMDDINAGREVSLVRSRALDPGASRITLRAFRDSLHALTALRTGTLDILFTEDEEVLAKGRSDQTLLSSECSGYRLLGRKGLQIRCGSEVELNDLKYLS